MKYRIETSSVAEAEADSAFLRLSEVTSPVEASQWYSGLLQEQVQYYRDRGSEYFVNICNFGFTLAIWGKWANV